MAGKVYFVAAVLGALLMFEMFTAIISLPIAMNVDAGDFSDHWSSCAASGVNANEMFGQWHDYNNAWSIDEDTKTILIHTEQDKASRFWAAWAGNVGLALMAHGLALMGLFGETIEKMSELNMGGKDSKKDTLKASVSMITWCLAGCTYFVLFMVVHSTRIGGEMSDMREDEYSNERNDHKLAEAFGLLRNKTATCWDKNPYLLDLESSLETYGYVIMVLLMVLNFVLVSLHAFAYARSAINEAAAASNPATASNEEKTSQSV
jgi:hypothetical protein